MASLLKKIKQRGLIYLFAIAFNRIVPERLFRFRYYYVLRIKDEPGFPETADSKTTIKIAESAAELGATEQLTFFNQSYTQGQTVGCLATRDTVPVGGFWAAQNVFDENDLGLRVQLNENQCWLFGALVSKSCRGQKIYPRIMKHLSEHMKNLGATDQLVAINPFNRSSMRAHAKYTDRPIAKIAAFRFLKWTGCFKRGKVELNQSFALNCERSPIKLSFRFEPATEWIPSRTKADQPAMIN